jgi:hypothetical protein
MVRVGPFGAEAMALVVTMVAVVFAVGVVVEDSKQLGCLEVLVVLSSL